MWTPWRKKKPEVVEMHPAEKEIIRRFADGNEACRDAAIEIHRKYIPTLGVRGNTEQSFMAEVDNPSPDLVWRAAHRKTLLDK